ncbi:MAG: hypothetical protein ACE5OZ_11330 [Candidatus Heimdallarchaeota archaeon]
MLHCQTLKILERYQQIKGALVDRENHGPFTVQCDRLAGRLVVKEIILLLQDCEPQEHLSKEVCEKLTTLETYVATHLEVVQDRTINPTTLWSLISPGVGLVEELLETLSCQLPRPSGRGLLGD